MIKLLIDNCHQRHVNFNKFNRYELIAYNMILECFVGLIQECAYLDTSDINKQELAKALARFQYFFELLYQ